MTTAFPILSPPTVSREPLGIQFARHMQLRGRKVFEACGCFWQSVGHGMFISLPPQLILDLSTAQTARLLRDAGIRGVRFPSTTRAGLPGGLYVFRGPSYGIENLHRNFRQKVRHGLDRCEVRKLNPDELIRLGLPLNLQTMRRQGRFDPEFADPRQWTRLVEAVFAVPAMSAFGAFSGTQLAAYNITCLEDGCFHIVHQMSAASDLDSCPNHVLDFIVTRDAVADPAVQFVTMGWSSLIPMPGLHAYKTRMGYDCEPHHCVIQFHPRLAPLFTSRPSVSIAAHLSKWRPTNQTLAVTAAVLNGAAITQQAAREAPLIIAPSEPACQLEVQNEFSDGPWRFSFSLLRRTFWCVRNFGLRTTLRQSQWWFRRHGPAAKPRPPLEAETESTLQPGDYVQVKSLAEIELTLDSYGATRGLKFLPDMARFCGRRFRVFKRLQTIFLEESRQVRKLKNTVLLENALCDGAEYHCDRSCFYYWREIWLTKLDPPEGKS